MKNVLIIGATSELARALVHKYAVEGWNLTLAAIEADELERLATETEKTTGASVQRVCFDATDYAGHASFYEALPVRPDVVLCAVGYMGDQHASRTDFDEVHRTITVNLTGLVSILNVVADDFERRGRGKIAVFSSVAGERGKQGNYIYGSTKGAVTTYLSGLRNRLAASRVHVMTVIPGFCRTRMVKSETILPCLLAEPDEVAGAVYAGLQRNRDVIYVRRIWRWIMLLVRHMPERLFLRLAYSRFHY